MRKPMVTRTIVTTKVTALCLDIEKGEPCNKVVTLPRTYKDEKALMKKLEEFNSDTLKFVHVVAKEEIETLYGMTEQDFIDNAVVLDPETRKALTEDEEIEQ